MHDLLALFDEKKLWPALSPERRFRLFVDEHKAIATNIRLGWTPWNIPAQVLQRQVKAVPGKEIELFRETLANYIQVGQQHLIGELIGWGGKRFTGTQEKDYIAAVIGAFSKSKTKDEKVIRQIFQQAIVSAEASKNIAAFQQLNRAVRNMVVPETKYDYKAPPRGKLVSDKGMIYFGKLDNWDPPLQHRGILLETGGAFHGPGTFDGKPNFAVVVLPDGRKLAGIVIVNRPGHENRNKSLKIYTSTDEQNWTQIGQCDDFRNEFRLDLREKNITARFIKVEKGQPENEPFHLRNICVYAD